MKQKYGVTGQDRIWFDCVSDFVLVHSFKKRSPLFRSRWPDVTQPSCTPYSMDVIVSCISGIDMPGRTMYVLGTPVQH